MAVYKVPQDVEAEDKLIGPFGFRQFIYLLIVAFACFVAYILSNIFIGLILIPLPFILFFGAIALPLRKDQPTEVYLAAILQYHLKSKIRMWQPDGVLSTVQITAPKTVEEKRTKDLSEDEALDRLGHLAQIMDTRGWASRGVFNPDVDSTAHNQLSDDAIEAAAQPDILDDQGVSAQSFDKLIDEQKIAKQQSIKATINQATHRPTTSTSPTPTPQTQLTPQQAPVAQETEADKALLKKVSYNPYPSAIHQQVIQPIDEKKNTKAPPRTQTPVEPKTTSSTVASPDIMKLVESPFSVATIASELHRKEESQAKEVEIKLH